MWIAALWLGCAGSSTQPDGPSGGGTDTGTRPGLDSGEPAIDADQQADNLSSSAGDFALDFLRDETYDRVLIEVDWVAGHRPDDAALDHLVGVVGQVCDKPGGIEVVLDDEIPSQGSPAWTVPAGQELEVAWRDRYRDPDSGTAVIYFLYLDGNSSADSSEGRVLGYAYRGSSLAIFEETIASTETGLPLLSGGGVEDAVLAHELGHLLGLVNNGVAPESPHQDTAHGAHCDDEGCLMYWAVETDLVGSLLGAGVPDFDGACLADLRAAREGR